MKLLEFNSKIFVYFYNLLLFFLKGEWAFKNPQGGKRCLAYFTSCYYM